MLPGTLFIVATPIGNLNDITLRAIQTLKDVQLILAEDTRHAQKLLRAYDIHCPMLSFHAHNEAQSAAPVIQRLQLGENIALISDAGTPLIQDPGYPLVKLAREHQVPVVPIPGPCALITALCASGMACDSFLFSGFLPAKTQARQAKLNALKNAEHTLIFYESTHRILDCIRDINEVFGEAYSYVLAKELTKTFERFISGCSRDILAFLQDDPAHANGEFVLILPPLPAIKTASQDESLLAILLETLPLKQAVGIAEKLSSTPRNQLYKLALELK